MLSPYRRADVSKIVKLVKLVGMLLQTKVYLFLKKKSD